MIHGLQNNNSGAIDPTKLTFDKPVISNIGDTCVILKPESTTIRILGSGKITAKICNISI